MDEVALAQVDAHVIAQVAVGHGVEEHQVAPLQIGIGDLVVAIVVALGLGGAAHAATLGLAISPYLGTSLFYHLFVHCGNVLFSLKI